MVYDWTEGARVALMPSRDLLLAHNNQVGPLAPSTIHFSIRNGRGVLVLPRRQGRLQRRPHDRIEAGLPRTTFMCLRSGV